MLKNVKRLRLLSLIITILFLVTAQAYGAGYANPHLLVSPADIEKNMGKWIVLDCRPTAAYNEGHIPGAIHLGDTCSRALRDITGPAGHIADMTEMKRQGEIEKILGRAGISPDKTVVVYGDEVDANTQSAGVGFFVLEYWGHKDVRFLNGGMNAWRGAGMKVETKPTKLPATKYKANPNPKILATTDEVIKIAKGEVKGVQLVDYRTPDEYSGKTPGRRVSALRGGHIPNTTVNINHVGLYDKETGKIKTAAELEKLHAKLDKTKRTIGYCRTGTRSSLAYFVQRLMGFKDPANYQDSWIYWSSREDLPIAR
ncbi:MAG: putative thiosulfate sulfurtransferase [Actinobacteria bacterium]|nr:putative thiosulfate sulfurtransferase [Actinomycetota bacterium]